MKYEKLKSRLIELSAIAPFGSHVKVADAVGISEAYCKKIRNGSGAKLDTESNRELLENMSEAYIYEINEQQESVKRYL